MVETIRDCVNAIYRQEKRLQVVEALLLDIIDKNELRDIDVAQLKVDVRYYIKGEIPIDKNNIYKKYII